MNGFFKVGVLSAAMVAAPVIGTAAFAQTDTTDAPAVTTEAPAEAPAVTTDAPAVETDAPVVATPDAAAPAAPIAIVNLPEGYVYVEAQTVTAEELKGVDLYDVENNEIAKLGDVVLGGDGTVAGVIVDVGGFLGLGARSVELAPDQIQVYRNDENALRAYTLLSKDELKALPEYTAPE